MQLQVKIFVPVKNPEQSGLAKAIDGPGRGPLWRMEIDNRQKSASAALPSAPSPTTALQLHAFSSTSAIQPLW